MTCSPRSSARPLVRSSSPLSSSCSPPSDLLLSEACFPGPSFPSLPPGSFTTALDLFRFLLALRGLELVSGLCIRLRRFSELGSAMWATALGRRIGTRASRIGGGGSWVRTRTSSTASSAPALRPELRHAADPQLRPIPALAMAIRPIAVFPGLALPLLQQVKHFSSREIIRMADGDATGGIVEIPLAQTGEGIADCELIRWFVSEGDMVDEFAPVCEVQSDKAAVVITSRYKGTVSQILHHPGDIVKVGETLLELMLEEGSPAAAAAEHANPNSEKPSMSDPDPRPKPANEEGSHPAVLATPAVRSLAKEYGVNLRGVPGSGPNGRITKGDVLEYANLRESAQDDIQALNEAPVHDEPQAPPTADSTIPPREYTPVPQGPSSGVFDGADTVIPVRGYRRAMAKAMTAAAAVPHFYYVEEIAMDKLTDVKRTLTEAVPLEPGVKLTHLPFLIKSLSMALKRYPVMNSTVDQAVTEIQVRASHNIGVAIATEHGLVVPNIKNVQRLSVLEIASELSRLIRLANTNALSTDDVTGGTITVSNFGAIGGKLGMPILNIPEVAIVAIGRMQLVARVPQLDESRVINVTWGADHRVVDGATVARFCNEWKLLIEQPERLLLTLQ